MKRLDHFLHNDERLSNTLASVSIRSATSGKIMYEHQGNVLLRPASNLKLLTTAAALSTLGPDYTFRTEFLTDGKMTWKFLNGNLYIKGMGDPTLLTSDLDQLAKIIKGKGIKYIRGDLVADDNWYDHVLYSIDLPWSDETKYGPMSRIRTC